MSNGSTLIAHCGSQRRTREALANLATPPATKSWRPVPHHDLVAELIAGLDARGIVVARDEYATDRADARIFGVMDLVLPGIGSADFGMALGFRGANDKSMAIQVIAAARVFVCDNMAFSGADGAVVLRKKHTARLDLGSVIPPAIDAFLGKADRFALDIDRMRGISLSDRRAKALIHDAFAVGAPLLPIRHLRDVSRLYFRDDEQRARFPDRSLWSLNNAFTEAVKALRPVPQHDAGRRIGIYFGRATDALAPSTAAVAFPVSLADGPDVAGPDPAEIIIDVTPAPTPRGTNGDDPTGRDLIPDRSAGFGAGILD